MFDWLLFQTPSDDEKGLVSAALSVDRARSALGESQDFGVGQLIQFGELCLPALLYFWGIHTPRCPANASCYRRR